MGIHAPPGHRQRASPRRDLRKPRKHRPHRWTSHGRGEREFNAGVQLLHQCFQQSGVTSKVYLNGWPRTIAFIKPMQLCHGRRQWTSDHSGDHLRMPGDL
jgi:hypothetical protein